MMRMDASPMNSSSWAPECPALSGSRRPRYCPAMTAPPVASAEKAFTSSTFTVSTRDTAEMAASPTWDTITESNRPTVMASSCSMTSGMISRRRSSFVKSTLIFLVSICSRFPLFLFPHRNSRGLI